ncbi:hypothetical protein [Kitasatospora sp. NPDC017646]|uniref:hypothetical protein n=1 Tax=Kitasatospora sp. NPDC017646 TaxID=3364024 RepID=UPI0037A1BA15
MGQQDDQGAVQGRSNAPGQDGGADVLRHRSLSTESPGRGRAQFDGREPDLDGSTARLLAAFEAVDVEVAVEEDVGHRVIAFFECLGCGRDRRHQLVAGAVCQPAGLGPIGQARRISRRLAKAAEFSTISIHGAGPISDIASGGGVGRARRCAVMSSRPALTR